MLSVSVVVPVRDDAVHLCRCLDALAEQSVAADEVIVVDNGSRDDSAAVARAAGAVVLTERVRGIARASARGYDRASGDVIVRLDADSVPPPGWIAAAVRLLDDPAVVAVTGPGRPRDGGPVVSRLWDVVYMRPYFVLMRAALGRPPLFGSAMAMRRRTWLAVRTHVHREDAEVHDDVDLSMQLDPGWRVVADPALEVQVSARPLSSLPSALLRTRRAFHTFRVNGRRANPVRRWARRARVAVRERAATRWSRR
ncbi:glycosyltransferase family A protein [Curtobacterium pusillum]|uniref:4,4'-diaponeurosporenoate glycosyltransferase n=1 Tax=Curtobacterium pusillum TaxID=69373 RepID=A0AAW3T3L3_9MICO|nr:glycosyltransferase family 2 protein [Curtobacterium pusillum]MBA8989578.1 glycosyltransferase involved in cell wall biosynthesis [Curtobacterium pusillum]NUU14930.1 glycosyltransferase family 2 protein [Curtobacterium pusillum]GLK32493.1 glycosyl hydrolase [Curtobacterium pusillum]